jgi:hypothetical protein
MAEPKVLTRESLAASAAERYAERHRINTREAMESLGSGTIGEATREKYRALVKLGSNPDPSAVDEILGVGWTQPTCSACGQSSAGPVGRLRLHYFKGAGPLCGAPLICHVLDRVKVLPTVTRHPTCKTCRLLYSNLKRKKD